MRILLLIPYNQEFTDVSYIIRDVAHKTNHQLIRLEEVMSNRRIIDTFNEEIEKADLVIADISGSNPNVMYELGIAQSLKKPTILIAQEGERKPFDISSSLVIIYDRKKLNHSLFNRLKSYLHTANINDLIKENTAKPEKKTMVFISYSHIDSEYLERLKIHLKPFEKKGLIDIWSDTKIKAGEKWKEQIEEALEKSVAAILLVSADFLASDFIIDNELPPLLKSAEEEGKLILPVVLKPCRFSKNENLSKFQAINDPIIPLSKMDENGKEEIYVKIADYIDDLLK